MDKASHSELVAKYLRLLPTAERRENGCLVWTATVPNGIGYPQIAIGSSFRDKSKPTTIKRVGVNRVAWEAAHGRMLGPEESVYHTCDERMCVEPTHLSLRRKGSKARG